MVDPAVDLVLRGGLALLLAVAATHKARDLPAFAAALAAYRLLPERVTFGAARALVGAELAAAGMLVVRGQVAIGPVLAAALLVVYTGAVAVNLARGRRDIDCGCAGPARRQPLSAWLVVRNVVLVAGALACLAPTYHRPLAWIDGLTVAGAVAGLAACYGALDRMVANVPRLALFREDA